MRRTTLDAVPSTNDINVTRTGAKREAVPSRSRNESIHLGSRARASRMPFRQHIRPALYIIGNSICLDRVRKWGRTPSFVTLTSAA